MSARLAVRRSTSAAPRALSITPRLGTCRSRGSGRGRAGCETNACRERLPSDLYVHKRRMLKAGPTVPAGRAAKVPAQYVARSIRAVADHKGCQGQRSRPPAALAMCPPPMRLLPVELAERGDWWGWTAGHSRKETHQGEEGDKLPCPACTEKLVAPGQRVPMGSRRVLEEQC
jgi:hypothetical protein